MKAEERAAKADTVHPVVPVAPVPIQTPIVTVGSLPQAPQGPLPGWYLDPDGSSLQRWWDGTQWTEFKQAAGLSTSGPDNGPGPPLHDAVGSGSNLQFLAQAAATLWD